MPRPARSKPWREPADGPRDRARPRPAGHRDRPLQPGPGLPRRTAGGPRRGVPRREGRLRLAPRADARGRHDPGPVPRRPRHPGRPHLPLLLPPLPQADRTAVPVLHPGGLQPAARRVQRLLPVGERAARQPALGPGGRRRRARPRRRRLRGHGPDGRRDGAVAGPPAGPRRRHGARSARGRGPRRRHRPAHQRLPAPARGAARAGERHRARQRPVRRRGLPRPARALRRRRPAGGLDHPLPAVLPHGVHEAHPRADLPRVRGPLPRPRRGPAGPAQPRARQPLQGDQRGAGERHPRAALPPLGARAPRRPADHEHHPHGCRAGRRRPGPRPARRRARARLAAPHRRPGAGHRIPRRGARLPGPGPRRHRVGPRRPLRRLPRLRGRPRALPDLGAERRGAHPRPDLPRPRHGRLPQQRHPPGRHGPGGLPGRASHRLPDLRRPPGRRPGRPP